MRRVRTTLRNFGQGEVFPDKNEATAIARTKRIALVVFPTVGRGYDVPMTWVRAFPAIAQAAAKAELFNCPERYRSKYWPNPNTNGSTTDWLELTRFGGQFIVFVS
jgi:hypothetical protein